jgi:hypothetical protein
MITHRADKERQSPFSYTTGCMTGHVSNTEWPRSVVVHGIRWRRQQPFLCATRVAKKMDLVSQLSSNHMAW